MADSRSGDHDYFPPPESQGGWRYLETPEATRARAGMDPAKLDAIERTAEEDIDDSWSLAVVRHGFLVREVHTVSVLAATRFDVWSCTKSFTGMALGILIDDSRSGRLEDGRGIDLDHQAYRYIPKGYPLSDPRKERITVRHLLTMTSGIIGEDHDVSGNRTRTWDGLFEHALGRCPNRDGRWVGELFCEPGTAWDYSDPAFAHLSLICANVAGKELDEVVSDRVFGPIGVESASWDRQGGGPFLGPHTNPHTGLHLSARDMARVGYLLLHSGAWNGIQVMPEWFVRSATRSSQHLNPAYGLTFWVNQGHPDWSSDLPADMFALAGWRCNRCYVIPSLDLVVARVGTGPADGFERPIPVWREGELISRVVSAII